jgi:membrane protease YdiL (CAAX protease family)
MSHSRPPPHGDPFLRILRPDDEEGMGSPQAEPRPERGPTAAASSAGAPQAAARAPGDLARVAPAHRYRVREVDGVRVLSCAEAPTVRVRLERGRSVSEAAARKAEPGTIFLDGAAQAPPFLDPQRCVYNLDHHEGCARPFTLATCEQAMVLVRRITDLRRRDWTVWANEPDMDTVLAIWVILNHHRLNGEDPRPREIVMPLLRLEGTIDVHGFGNLELAGLTPQVLAAATRWMESLRKREEALRASGRWERADALTYVADRLRTIDSRVYPPGTFDDLEEIEELARVGITDSSVAVACRSGTGIYETETQLRRLYGDRLGLIILERGPGAYSLRQVDPELPASLDSVYGRLNMLDPAAGGPRSENRWGGSGEIGGSPRRTGTRLPVGQIAAACREAFQRPTAGERLASVARTAGASVALVAGAAIAAWLASALLAPLPGGPGSAFTAAMALVAAGLLLAARRSPGLYGLRRPSSHGAWAAAPFALAGALLGGAWAPSPDVGALGPGLAGTIGLAVAVACAAAAELVFRGFVYGRVAWALTRARAGRGPDELGAALISAALYAPWIALPWLAAGSVLPLPESIAPWAPFAGALLVGGATGVARARSKSLLVPLVLHVACALVLGALP